MTIQTSRAWVRGGATLVCSLALVAAAGFRPVYGGQPEGRRGRVRRRARSYEPPIERRILRTSGLPSRVPKVRIAAFDVDSTWRVPKRGRISPRGPDDVRILPGVATKLASLGTGPGSEELRRRDGSAPGNDDPSSIPLITVGFSNQGAIASGRITMEKAEQALAETVRLLGVEGAQVNYFDFAEGYDHDRKPDTGMAQRLAEVVRRELGAEIDWEHSFMVGDAGWKRAHKDKKTGQWVPADREPDGRAGTDFSNSDRRFAENVRELFGLSPDGFAYYHPRDFFGWAERGVRGFQTSAEVDEFLEKNPDFPR